MISETSHSLTWEIAHFGSFHFGKYSWEVDARETALTIHQKYYENDMNIKHCSVSNGPVFSQIQYKIII